MLHIKISHIIEAVLRWLDSASRAEAQADDRFEQLLDMKIREAMHTEYGRAKAPSGVFYKVLRAIKEAEQKKVAQANRTLPAGAWAMLHKLAHRTMIGVAIKRLAPTAAALVLILSFAHTDINRLLGGNAPKAQFYYNPEVVANDTTTSDSAVVDGVVSEASFEMQDIAILPATHYLPSATDTFPVETDAKVNYNGPLSRWAQRPEEISSSPVTTDQETQVDRKHFSDPY